MKLQTKYLGEIEIKQSQIITFTTGLPGFQSETEFVLLNLPEEESGGLFQVLQSVKSPDLAFVVTNPHYFYKAYEFKLNDSLINALQIDKKEEVMVLSIVTVKAPFKESTMNLKAPIIINHVKRLGKQYILDTDQYETKSPITVEGKKGDD